MQIVWIDFSKEVEDLKRILSFIRLKAERRMNTGNRAGCSR